MKTRSVQTALGKKLDKLAAGVSVVEAKVGWFPSARYEDGTPVASIAAQNEYGNPLKHIPARPFMQPTVTDKQKEWKDVAERGAKALLHGAETTTTVVTKVAKKAEGDVKKTIANLWEPPLSPVTVELRRQKLANGGKITAGLTKPLIETGLMLGTLSTEITSK